MKNKRFVMILVLPILACPCFMLGNKPMSDVPTMVSQNAIKPEDNSVNNSCDMGVNATLAQLNDDKFLDNYYVVKINDEDYFKSKISAYEQKLWAQSQEYDFCDIVLSSFSMWCSEFLGKDSDIEVYQLPYTQELDKHSYVWSAKGEGDNCFKDRGDNICFDPNIYAIAFNDALLEQRIVATVRILLDSGSAVIKLYAIIPSDGKYYRWQCTFYFSQELNLIECNTKDIKAAKSTIERAFPEYVDAEGWVSDDFFEKYLRWCFNSMGTPELQRLNIDPRTELLTIRDLFNSK